MEQVHPEGKARDGVFGPIETRTHSNTGCAPAFQRFIVRSRVRRCPRVSSLEIVLVTFLIAEIKHPDEGSSREEGFIPVHRWGLQSIMAGARQWQGLGAAAGTAPNLRTWRGMRGCYRSALVLH